MQLPETMKAMVLDKPGQPCGSQYIIMNIFLKKFHKKPRSIFRFTGVIHQPTLMLLTLAFAFFPVLGRSTFNSPFLYSAVIFVSSASSGKVKDLDQLE